MMQSNCLLLLLSLFLFATLLADGERLCDGELVCTVERADINDSRVKEMAEFAVSEFNKTSRNKELVFQNVVSGLVQLVQGLRYTLVIAVRDESLPSSPILNYEACVLEVPWMNSTTLDSFRQVYYDTVIKVSEIDRSKLPY
ncbi:cysteine proteinase inhibitor 1-like [Argentina anserina]|uniref:cysteine proteinase inhibitor 1-like n=1 Tax=Argentina anserina TaxID=57926 RepID=UPI002176351C|nr:cysteine proteinase inhibitor 1-like [Potentilla anserina]